METSPYNGVSFKMSLKIDQSRNLTLPCLILRAFPLSLSLSRTRKNREKKNGRGHTTDYAKEGLLVMYPIKKIKLSWPVGHRINRGSSVYYAKNGWLIPTAKRRKETKQLLAPVEGLFFKPKYCTCFNFIAVLFLFLSSPWGSVYRFLHSIFWF